jgi:hypothetical protein
MKRTMGLLTLVAVVGLVSSFAFAAAADATSKPAATKGVFVKVDGTNLVVTVEKVDTTIATDDKTTVTVDNAAAKLADLKAGMKVSVTMADGGKVAAKVEAKTAPAPKAKA